MLIETRNGQCPPQTPENPVIDDNQFFEDLLQFRAKYRLRQQYTNLPSEDRFLPPQEPQEVESKQLELAQDLIINPYLKEVGYDVVMEMERLLRNVNSGVEVGAAAKELEVNLRTYDLEIIKSRPVLPHLNRFDFKYGILRMVGSNGEPVVDAISAKERNGSVLAASQAIENFLLTAENNSFAVLMNPAGWNGFTDEHGREADPHLNAEVMVFWKDNNSELKGLTLVADLEEEQARKTMVSLGVSANTPEVEQERLANIVRNPALLSLPEAYANPFTYVLDKMLAQRGSGDFLLRMRKGPSEIRTIDEVRADIQRFEELLLLSQEEEKLAGNPKRYILENAAELGDKVIQQELVYKIEKAIVLLTREYRNSNSQVTVLQSSGAIYRQEIRQDDFSAEIAFLKTRSGCPPSVAARILGGSSLGSSTEGGSAGGGIVESDRYGSLEFQCPKCKQTNRRPKGQLIPNCQHCHANVRC